MTDAIFGLATGNEFFIDSGFWVYVNSLCACGFEGDKILFTAEMPKEVRSTLYSKGFEIVDLYKEELKVLYRDRHLAYYRFNLEHEYDYIVTTDTRDTLFQKNPIDWIKNTTRKATLFLVAEGFKHEVSLSNIRNQERYQSSLTAHRKDFKDWDVINGGTAIGKASRMVHFDLAIWLSGIHAVGGDQCATNYVYQYLLYDPTVQVLYPECSNFCVTGEDMNIRPNVYDTALNYENFYLFHQWDRTKYKHKILKEWS